MPLILLPNAYGDAATNMAIDASLLYALPSSIAAFRHYGWTEPAITFGYTQRLADVQAAARLNQDLRLCRRLTGGGIVDHRYDWTYALAIQAHLSAADIPAKELYTILHRCIQNALEAQLIQTQLAPCHRACEQADRQRATAPDQCFVHPSTDDVLRPDGTKIAGAAMKRARQGLLIQGSIDRSALPEDFDYLIFCERFQQQLSEALSLPIGTTEDLRTLFDSRRIEEERIRFESSKWLAKR